MVGEPSHVKQLSLNHVCKIGLEAHSGVMYNHSGVTESYAGVMEAHHGPVDADPGSMESHNGAIVAQPGAIKSSWSRRGTHCMEPGRLTPKP
jgi:hypothetical protein